MSRGLLDPKVDFVFKNIFGSHKHPNSINFIFKCSLKTSE